MDDFVQKCELLTKQPGIRFAGILDMMGNLIEGRFRSGLVPLKDENQRKKMFMEAILRVRTRQDFDENLGPVSYAAARRKKVVLMTFLLDNKVLFISAEPDIDIDDTARKVLQILHLE
ncbi:MAG: hypothetical protein KC483_06620 [Nitrosarchaeum sp.]|nr:hypothetical protein [Nitrosarchaeum sp.]